MYFVKLKEEISHSEALDAFEIEVGEGEVQVSPYGSTRGSLFLCGYPHRRFPFAFFLFDHFHVVF